MARYLFDDKSVHELARISRLLYETFKKADVKILDARNTPLVHDTDVDKSLHPQDFYSFHFGNKSCFIRLYRHFYTLECRGFVPTNLKPFDVNLYNFELYRNCFGRTKDFGEILNNFFDVVHELTNLHVRELF